MARSPISPLARRVWVTLRDHALVSRGDRVLAAVSGGPDSAALLGALAELAPRHGFEVIAAHANHQLRAEASELDARCAQELCQRLGIPLRLGVCAVAPAAGLEARARRVRYSFLEEVATEEGCDRIATGHTLDDQAETVVMRWLRGAALGGLAGIPIRRGKIIRPLLESSRGEVMAYIASRGLPVRHDASNDDRRFTRNRIRHEVMPVLRAIEPAALTVLARSAMLAGDDVRVAEAAYRDALAQAVVEGGALSVPAVRSLTPPLRAGVVRGWLARQLGSSLDLEHAHIAAIVRCLSASRPNAEVALPGGIRLRRVYDQLRIEPDEEAVTVAVGEVVVVSTLGRFVIGAWTFEAGLVEAARCEGFGDAWTYFADAAGIAGPAQLRPARRGDRIAPFGMSHSRKLHDVFVDRRVPRPARWGRPVLEVNGELAWVPGVVRGSQAPVGPATALVWRVTASPDPRLFRAD